MEEEGAGRRGRVVREGRTGGGGSKKKRKSVREGRMEVAIVLCLHCQEPLWHRLVFIARSRFGIDWSSVPGAALASTGCRF